MTSLWDVRTVCGPYLHLVVLGHLTRLGVN
jgi:hypothetical protein